MSFPRYQRYKDTGVEWLDRVPEHWEVSRLGFESWVRARLGWKGLKAEEYVDDGFAFLSTPNIKGLDIDFVNVNFITQERYDESPEIKVREGDVLLAKDGSTLGTVNIVRKLPRPTTVNSSIAVITPNSRLNGVFLYYLFSTSYIEHTIQRTKGGMGVPHLFQADLNKFYLPVPPIAEQIHIAHFLDKETAKIDELVADQQRLMGLLKEKRQAVISNAVTKGLNPNAPMKPSGIEWLGDVPRHWELTPLKYVVSLRSGGTPSKTNLAYWDGDVPWASSKDLKSETLSDTGDHITQKALDDRAASLVPAGAILIVVRGMILIHTFPVVKMLVPMAINQDLKALTPSSKLNVDFLAWLLRGASRETMGRIDEAAHGTKVLRIETWNSIVLPIPPLDEQSSIVARIVESMSKLDTLTAEAQRAIDLLKERRTALISAAVTGQIDVRQARERHTA